MGLFILHRVNFSKFVKYPMDSGRSPPTLHIVNSSKLIKFPMESGMGPVKL